MFNVKLGDLTIVTNTPLPVDQQWFSVACSDNAVTLMFGDNKTLRINSVGLWTHSVLFWQGELDISFKLLVDSLPAGNVIYKNDDVIALYLRNNHDYGCLQLSVRLHKNNEMIIRNLQEDVYLGKLDALFALYSKDHNVDACLNFWVNKPLNINLDGDSYTSQLIRKDIFNEFTKEFIEDPESTSSDIENKMAAALKVGRVDKIRYIIARMFKRARELNDLYG